MKSNILALLSGFGFSSGLAMSGMMLPTRVKGFLDVTGDWDPSLAFVMAAGVGVYFVMNTFIKPRLQRPLFAEVFQVPQAKKIDAPLVVGAAVFGAGWGLAGICPGPAVGSLFAGDPSILLFIGSMVYGIYAAGWLKAAVAKRQRDDEASVVAPSPAKHRLRELAVEVRSAVEVAKVSVLARPDVDLDYRGGLQATTTIDLL